MKKPSETNKLRVYMEKEHNVLVGKYCIGACFSDDFNKSGHVIIRNYCSFGNNTKYEGKSTLNIGFDVHLGANVVITEECKNIGNGTVIEDGLIIDKDIPSYTVVSKEGIRARFDDVTSQKLDDSHWFYMTPEELTPFFKYLPDLKKFAQSIIDHQRAFGYL